MNKECLEKLKNGVYVRTDNGIDRLVYVLKYDECNYNHYHFEKGGSMTNPEYYVIDEPSYNLKDLIKVGDIINGRYFDGTFIWHLQYGWIGIDEWEEKKIETILTKEQYEKECYKAGE